MKQQKKGAGANRLGRWLGAPVRALSRACDSYVRKMSACAGAMPMQAGAYGRGGYAPGAMQQAATFSSRSAWRGGCEDDGEVSELVRAMSQRQQGTARGGGVAAGAALPPRSRSVAFGRIDEDAPFDFGANDAARLGSVLPPPAVRRARVGLPPRPPAGAGFGAVKKGAVVHGG